MSTENPKNILHLERTASHKNGTECNNSSLMTAQLQLPYDFHYEKFSLSSGIFKESTISDTSI